jgi:uncharacterized protein
MRSRRAVRVVAAAGIAVFALALWALWWEPRRLLLNETVLDLSCWTADPITVAAVSDLHVGSPGVDLEKLDRIVRTINESRPDLVLLLGDFVIQGVRGGQFVEPEIIAEHLRHLRAPLGTYAVLGNHDAWLGAGRVKKAIAAAGIPVIDDAVVPLGAEGRSLILAGVSDFWTGRHDVAGVLAQLPAEGPVIVMTHNPDIFPSVSSRVCLTVAGHTHGGQVALPLIGRPVVPSRYGQRYAIGHVEEAGRHLFVTSGVGTSIFPVRFRVPPEVSLLRLQGRGL